MTLVKNDTWVLETLGITNYRTAKKLFPLYECIAKWPSQEKDIVTYAVVEFGVFRGANLLSLAEYSRQIGREDIKVYGFDSFTGFPPVVCEFDEVGMFEAMAKAGTITNDHYARVQEFQRHKRFINEAQELSPNAISSSGNFGDTSPSEILRKVAHLGLTNVELIEGDFADSVKSEPATNLKIIAASIDCDLYESYLTALDYISPRLEEGGVIYLDEYYSLKFPGGKLATDQFLQKHPDEYSLTSTADENGFERYYLKKETGAPSYKT